METLKKSWNYLNKHYFIVLLIFSSCWFGPLLQDGFIMGDCTRLLNTFKYADNPLLLAFSDIGVCRPVFFCVIVFLYRIFGHSYVAFWWTSVFLSAFTGYILYKIINKRVGGYAYGIVASVIYTVAIYSYYGITQVYGIMEQMCLLFVILFYDSMIDFVEKEDVYNFVCSVVYYGLALFTHERFLVLFGVFFLQISFFSFSKKYLKKIIYICCASIPLVLFVFFKKVVFNTPIFRGTAQQSIHISLTQILSYTIQTILSMFGFNYGPPHLFGNYNFSYYSNLCKLMTICSLIFVLGFILLFVYTNIIKNPKRIFEIKQLALFIFLEGGTILCFCISERIEMRQIYAPYVILIMYMLFCLGKINQMRFYKIVATLFVTITIVVNSLNYQHYLGDLYFMRVMSYSKSFYNLVMSQGEYRLKNKKIYVFDQVDLVWGINANETYNICDLFWDNSDVETIVWQNVDEIISEISVDLDNGVEVIVVYPETVTELGKYVLESEKMLEGLYDIPIFR